MKAKTIAGGSLIALGAVALTAVIAANPFSTQAATSDPSEVAQPQTLSGFQLDTVTPSQIAQPDGLGQLQVASAATTSTKPYIGIIIGPAVNGSVEVIDVLDDGPSAGVLEDGDVITAVNGEAIESSKDLTSAIADTGSGGSITLTVTRDDQSQDVDITVGEREITLYTRKHHFGSVPRFQMDMFKQFSNLGERFASGQVVISDDDGNFQTYRAVSGTVTTVDADAGTFTLQPKDGSDPIDYTINDETVINMSRTGDLGGLNTEDQTYVVDVDGEVKLVYQGNLPGMVKGFGHGFGKGHKRGHSFHFGRSGRSGPGGIFGGPNGFDPGSILGEIRQRLPFLNDDDFSGRIPADVQERLNQFRAGRNADGTLRIEIVTPDGSETITVPQTPSNAGSGF